MKKITNNSHPTPKEKKSAIVAKMFNRIAHRYDLLNRVVSFGQDIRWRKQIGQYLPEKDALEHLDLATGTGDIPIMILGTSNGNRIKHTLGLDISTEMIRIGKQKVLKKGLSKQITLKTGDATKLDLKNNSKDSISMAFGIRNVDSVENALSEMKRVLRPNGRALILEFSIPKQTIIRLGYLFYFRHILPIVGGLITGDYSALKYLNKSVEAFPYGQAFLKKMKDAGFKKTKAHSLCFGIATIYQGDV